MHNPSFLQKRDSPNFDSIPPLRRNVIPHLRNTSLHSPFHPFYNYYPNQYSNSNFNPSFPHISLGFSQHSMPLASRTRYLDFRTSFPQRIPVVTGHKIPGNQFHSEKTSTGKKSDAKINLKYLNEIVPSKRKYRKKGGYALSALQGDFYEKKVMSTQSSRIKDFWKRKTNTYPFTFKQTKVLKEKDEEGVAVILEKHRYDFKRVTPNLIEKKRKPDSN